MWFVVWVYCNQSGVFPTIYGFRWSTVWLKLCWRLYRLITMLILRSLKSESFIVCTVQFLNALNGILFYAALKVVLRAISIVTRFTATPDNIPTFLFLVFLIPIVTSWCPPYFALHHFVFLATVSNNYIWFFLLFFILWDSLFLHQYFLVF